MNIRFAYCADSKHVVSQMQKIFGINELNSPAPLSNVLLEEPSLQSVMENCQRWAEVCDIDIFKKIFNCDDILTFIEQELLPYVRTFCFAYELFQDKEWQNKFMHSPENIINELSVKLDRVDNVMNFIDHKECDKTTVANTMLLQSVLHHTSQTREKINYKNVLDVNTFYDMIIILRMDIYLKLNNVKKAKRMEIIGDVTLQNALSVDSNTYATMIHTHTHGLSGKEYWALLEAALDDQEKLTIFKSKTNNTFDMCVKKLRKKRVV